MIHISNDAVSRILDQSKSHHKLPEILVDVKSTGCSGLEYKLNWAKDVSSDLLIFNDKNVKVYITLAAQKVLEGATLIVKREGLNEGFEWQNPNEKSKCGCGKSFQI